MNKWWVDKGEFIPKHSPYIRFGNGHEIRKIGIVTMALGLLSGKLTDLRLKPWPSGNSWCTHSKWWLSIVCFYVYRRVPHDSGLCPCLVTNVSKLPDGPRYVLHRAGPQSRGATPTLWNSSSWLNALKAFGVMVGLWLVYGKPCKTSEFLEFLPWFSRVVTSIHGVTKGIATLKLDSVKSLRWRIIVDSWELIVFFLVDLPPVGFPGNINFYGPRNWPQFTPCHAIFQATFIW